jgi:glucan phosphoethanolaminetransferase (alkaline phosphatase superfamily)
MAESDPVARSGRNESTEERMDRNWMELIQELRVLQTGVQILGGFLLTLPFQERFKELDDWQTTLYLCNVLVAALTTILIVMPVSVHRRLFRRGLKATLVSNADLVTKLALGGVALLIVGSAALVFDVTIGRTAGLVTGGTIILIVLVSLWECLSGFFDAPCTTTTGTPPRSESCSNRPSTPNRQPTPVPIGIG